MRLFGEKNSPESWTIPPSNSSNQQTSHFTKNVFLFFEIVFKTEKKYYICIMSDIVESAQTTPPPSFDTVWAILQEVSLNQKETDRRMKETALHIEETDRIVKENARQMEETGRRIDEYNKRFGDFTNRFGEVVEYMIVPNLLEKFEELGLVFLKANKHTKVSDKKNNLSFEIDIMLENGDKALLVEVETNLTTENIQDHIKRIEKMRNYADLHGDKRSFLGAVAGVVLTDNAKEYALRQGLYVIEPSGETFNITPPQGNPKEW